MSIKDANSSSPYASPNTVTKAPKTAAGDTIQPQKADLGTLSKRPVECWKERLGLLIGSMVVVFVVGFCVNTVLDIVITIFLVTIAHFSLDLANVLAFGAALPSLAFQLFLAIGQAKLALKVARNEPVGISELFKGGPQYLPVLGASALIGLLCVGVCLLGATATAFIGPAVGLPVLLTFGVLGIVCSLIFWPYFYLLVDDQTGIVESFSVAYKIGSQNKLNSFVLFLCSIAVVIVGFLACFVGLIFAYPLAAMIWPVAYLEMTGQE